MNKKIASFFLILLGSLAFCLLMIYLFYILFQESLAIFLTLFILLYILNLIFLYNNLSKDRNSSQAKLSWSIVLIFIPFFGAIFYYIGGYSSINVKGGLNNLFILESETSNNENSYTKPKQIYSQIFNENLNFQNRKTITNSDFDIYDNGSKKFNALINDLEKAESFINIQYFIINDGIIWKKIEKILIKKANSGIEVNILADYFGCLQTRSEVFDNIKASKVKFEIVNPTKTFLSGGHLNYRAHNKFVIIDNKVAYFGGMNLGDDYANLYSKYGTWLDLQIAFKGEIVNEMNNHFINQWFYWTGESIKHREIISIERDTNIQFSPDGPNFNQSTFVNYFLNLIKVTEKSIRIVTPYVVIPKKIIDALIEAKKRGVNIELITAGRADKKTAYEIGKIYLKKLLNSGINVYRMDNMFIHSKFFLFDDNNLITGTTNLDYRAIYLHFESNLFIHDEKLYSKLEQLFDSYKFHANLLKFEEYNKFLYTIKSPFYYFLAPMF